MTLSGDSEEGADGGGNDDDKKRQKRGGKGMMKAKKKDDTPKQVTVSRAPRGKKKSVTVVTGLSTFGMHSISSYVSVKSEAYWDFCCGNTL